MRNDIVVHRRGKVSGFAIDRMDIHTTAVGRGRLSEISCPIVRRSCRQPPHRLNERWLQYADDPTDDPFFEVKGG